MFVYNFSILSFRSQAQAACQIKNASVPQPPKICRTHPSLPSCPDTLPFTGHLPLSHKIPFPTGMPSPTIRLPRRSLQHDSKLQPRFKPDTRLCEKVFQSAQIGGTWITTVTPGIISRQASPEISRRQEVRSSHLPSLQPLLQGGSHHHTQADNLNAVNALSCDLPQTWGSITSAVSSLAHVSTCSLRRGRTHA